MRAAIAIVMLASVCALAACRGPMACVARGDQTTYPGTVLYAGQTTTVGSTTQSPLTGSFVAPLVVDDYTPACPYDGMEFTISLGSCTITAVAGDTVSVRPNILIGADFVLAPSQSCDITLPTGTVHIAFDQGYFGVDALDHLSGTLSGTVTSLDGVEVTSGHVDLQFTGQ